LQQQWRLAAGNSSSGHRLSTAHPAQPAAPGASPCMLHTCPAASRTLTQTWSEAEMAAADAADSALPEANAAVQLLGAFLTGTYASLQGKAGLTVGIRPGAAWRTALAAAARSGAQQVVLGDRPASVSERRLAEGVVGAAAGRAAAALGLLAAGAAATAQPALDAYGSQGDAAAVAVGLAGAAALMWPIVGPFVEAYQFSRMSADQVCADGWCCGWRGVGAAAAILLAASVCSLVGCGAAASAAQACNSSAWRPRLPRRLKQRWPSQSPFRTTWAAPWCCGVRMRC